MKRNNKKGFTIVELVIVIAVIAILAAVLIPTFGGVIETAHKSAALQEATAAYKEAYAIALSDDGEIDTDDNAVITPAVEGGAAAVEGIEASGFIFKVTVSGTTVTWNVVEYPTDFDYNVTIENGKVVIGEKRS